MKYEPNEKDYNIYVQNVTPTSNTFKNCLWAFLVGGAICTLGEIILKLIKMAGIDEENSYGYVSMLLVLLSVILTSLNLYKKIAKYGGAGALVPITGFANGVCAPIVEFQTEGEVFGKGVKAFTIAGPVILYGIFTSWLLGLIYWILKIMEIV
ncbi:MAG: SpoVA/SpoVAEb family sporulation membrane protein [Coprococcus sp.]|nr:SpoVA/SpoVAEb family sporulation membrane protein [Coprococcus sp.]